MELECLNIIVHTPQIHSTGVSIRFDVEILSAGYELDLTNSNLVRKCKMTVKRPKQCATKQDNLVMSISNTGCSTMWYMDL